MTPGISLIATLLVLAMSLLIAFGAAYLVNPHEIAQGVAAYFVGGFGVLIYQGFRHE